MAEELEERVNQLERYLNLAERNEGEAKLKLELANKRIDQLQEEIKTLTPLLDLKQAVLELLATMEIMQDKVLYEIRMNHELLETNKSRKTWEG